MNTYTIISLALWSFGTILMGLSFLKRYKKTTKIIGLICLVLGMTLTTFDRYKVEKKLIHSFEDFTSRLDRIINNPANQDKLDSLIILKNEYNNWASDFAENKELRKISFKRTELNKKEERLLINNKWVEFYNYSFDIITNIISAYNNHSDQKIYFKKNIEQLNNIYDKNLNDSILMLADFQDKVIWKISLSQPRVKLGQHLLPDIIIDMIYPVKEKPNDLRSIKIAPDLNINKIEGNNQLFIVVLNSNFEVVDIVPSGIPLDSYKSYLGDYLVKIFEYQLLIID